MNRTAMVRFIHRENLEHYRRLLAEPDVANDQMRHDVLLRLLADEEAKNAILGPSDSAADPPSAGGPGRA